MLIIPLIILLPLSPSPTSPHSVFSLSSLTPPLSLSPSSLFSPFTIFSSNTHSNLTFSFLLHLVSLLLFFLRKYTLNLMFFLFSYSYTQSRPPLSNEPLTCKEGDLLLSPLARGFRQLQGVVRPQLEPLQLPSSCLHCGAGDLGGGGWCPCRTE